MPYFPFGGLSGMGDKLFALSLDAVGQAGEHAFVLDIRKEKLEKAPGFEKGNWPNMADIDWANRVNTFYGIKGSKMNA